MPENLELNVEARVPANRGAIGRLRRLQNKVPGIVYGAGLDPTAVAIEERVLSRVMQHEAFFSQIIELRMDDKAQRVIVRDMQRHPATSKVMHIDFMRVSEDQEVQMTVPIHFLNEQDCEGVKTQSGMVSRSLRDVVVSCLPKHVPEYLAIDIKDLVIGKSLHLSDLELPDRVSIPILARGIEYDSPIVSVLRPRGVAATDEDGEVVEGEEAEDTEATEDAAGDSESE